MLGFSIRASSVLAERTSLSYLIYPVVQPEAFSIHLNRDSPDPEIHELARRIKSSSIGDEILPPDSDGHGGVLRLSIKRFRLDNSGKGTW